MTVPTPRRPSHRVQRALLVDDDKFMLTVMSDMLHDLGVAGISTATDGIEGMAALERMPARPDVVLCDLGMPGNDGFQFMEQLGAMRYPGGVILISGLDSRVMKSASLMGRFHRLQILDALTKPVTASALGAALAKLA